MNMAKKEPNLLCWLCCVNLAHVIFKHKYQNVF